MSSEWIDREEPTAEQIAAFIDGGLSGSELEGVIAYLAKHPKWCTLVADVFAGSGRSRDSSNSDGAENPEAE